MHRQFLWVVDLPPITADDDPRVLAVLKVDEEDAPVAQLAVLLAPALLLTKDHDLLDAGLGVARWADALGLVQQVVAVDGAVYRSAQMLGLTVIGSGSALRGAGRVVVRSPVLLGLVIVILFMLLTDWREPARARLSAAGDSFKRGGTRAMELTAEAVERRQVADQELQALVVSSGKATPLSTAARLLATSRLPAGVEFITECLDQPKTALRRLLSRPPFIETATGFMIGRQLP